MGIGSIDATKKVATNRDFVTAIKKVFAEQQLKEIIQCLKNLKTAKELDIAGVLRQLKTAMFKDQENPRDTDKQYEGKK